MILAYVMFCYNESNFALLLDEDNYRILDKEIPELLPGFIKEIAIFVNTVGSFPSTFTRDFILIIEIDIEEGYFSMMENNAGLEEPLGDLNAMELVIMMHELSGDSASSKCYFWDFEKFRVLYANSEDPEP